MSDIAIGQVRMIEDVPSLVTDGYYYDPIYNRLSNFWTWCPIQEDGTLGKAKSGYGGDQFGKLLEHTLIVKLRK